MAAMLNNVKLMQETSVVHPHRTTAYHGETVNFSIDFRSYGAQVDLTGATAALYWRVPSDEEGYWHQGEATCSGSTAEWAWDATMDNGESPVTWFLKVDADDSNDTTSYRATGEIRLLASPGFVPAVVPPARITLDFDYINVLHAPYYTQAETDTAIANAIADIPAPVYPVTSVNGKTGAVVLNAADVGAVTESYVNTAITTATSPLASKSYVDTGLSGKAATADVALAMAAQAFGPWVVSPTNDIEIRSVQLQTPAQEWAFIPFWAGTDNALDDYILDEGQTTLEWPAGAEHPYYAITATRTATTTAYRLGPDVATNPNRDKALAAADAVPAVVAPSTSATAGQAADAKATGDALADTMPSSATGVDIPCGGEVPWAMVPITGMLSDIIDTQIPGIQSLIPSTATPSNKLATAADVPAVSAETWTFTLQGGTTVTKSVAVY